MRILAVLSAVVFSWMLVAFQQEFARERGGDTGALKDALEGKAPPPLRSQVWLNVQKPLTWESLKGKVVLLEFWAHW
jgi:hypothetical protein